MKNFVVALFVAGAIAAPSLAFADEAEGRIKTMNSWSVTLQDGLMYTFTDRSKIKELKPGDEVKVTYQPHPDENIGIRVDRKSSK